MEKDITMGEFHTEYMDYREGTVAPATRRADDLAIRKFTAHLRDGHRTPLPHIRPRHGDTFISRCTRDGLKPTSTTNMYRHLHKFFSVGALWDYLKANPFDGVNPPKIFKAPPLFIPIDEIGPFLAGVENPEKRLLMTAFYATGRRRCELLNLHWSDIDLENRQYRVHVTKVHRDMILPISNLFNDVLIEQSLFQDGSGKVFPKWRNPDSVTHWVKQELIKGGYPRLHLHHLRHSFASAFVFKGGDIWTLSNLLTHSNVSTTQIYTHVTPGKLAAAIELVEM